jgi:hypothetical protein
VKRIEVTRLPDGEDLGASVVDWSFDDGAGNLLDSLAASSQAELEMHVTARAALLNLLSVDPTVDELHWRWMHATSFGRAIYEFIEHLGRTAEATGFANAGELLGVLRGAVDGCITVRAEDEAVADRISRSLSAGAAEAGRLLNKVIHAIKELEPDPLAEEAIGLVRDEWQLPLPWLAMDLLRCWMVRMWNIAFGTSSVVELWVEPDGWDAPAPTVDFRFEATPGETTAEAFVRFWREAIDAVMKPLQAAAAPLPRGRLTDDAIAERYVEWWYRRRVLKESVRSIADKIDGKRSLVRYGIAQVERWLSVANCVWKDDQAA